MNRQRLIVIVLVALLLAGNIFFGVRYLAFRKQLIELQENLQQQEINTKVLSFGKLFIEKILRSDEEISFDDRLILENAVRGLNDENILDIWQKFVDSQTEEQAQENVRDLLESLFTSIKLL